MQIYDMIAMDVPASNAAKTGTSQITDTVWQLRASSQFVASAEAALPVIVLKILVDACATIAGAVERSYQPSTQSLLAIQTALSKVVNECAVC